MTKEEIAANSESMTDFLPPDAELLAALLWDHFGPKMPASTCAEVASKKPATDRQIAAYRQCANDIIRSWRINHLIETLLVDDAA
jgi:hypothetical protein